MRHLVRTGLFVCALLATAVAANAAPITYKLSAIAPGTLDGVPLGSGAPVAFTITGVGDTDDVTACAIIGLPCVTNFVSASIEIAGVGTFDFVTPVRFSWNQDAVNFGRAFGTLIILSVGSWDLVTPIGPISGTAHFLQWPESTVPALPPVVTTGGVLAFNDGFYQTTFQAVPGAPVPEPTTMLLLGTGVLAGAVRGRMTRRR